MSEVVPQIDLGRLEAEALKILQFALDPIALFGKIIQVCGIGDQSNSRTPPERLTSTWGSSPIRWDDR